MKKNQIIKKTVEYVKKTLEKSESGHDWWHVYRVWRMSLRIAKEEKCGDLFVIQLAALLHDISDWKFNSGDDSIGPKLARTWLEKLQVGEDVISHVCQIIKEISFKGAGVKSKINTKEGMIVQDADRLDAIGAIGIARAFSYGGYKMREIYNPEIKIKLHKTFEEYKSAESTTVNHFYEKLFLLKGLMNTKTGKRIAERRHKLMESYLKEFFKEWKGET